jgi:hypothetical protein
MGTEFSSLALCEANKNLIQFRHQFIMIFDEIRAQIRAGRKVPELIPMFSDFCRKTALYKVAKEFAAGIVEKPKTKKKQPWWKIDPKMAATIIRRLTINKAHHSIRSIAKDFGLDGKSIRNIFRKKGINYYKKKRRNLISMTQEATRRFCCMRFRKVFRKSDLADFLFVDECYFTVQKSFNHQNERCYGRNFECIPDRKMFKQLPKTPLSAMVFASVSCEGRTPLVVLKSGFRLNQFTYIEQCVSFVRKKPALQADTRNGHIL